jgi:8-oxo-dGTP pyrophosphatase MutT (NUDIX family)
LHFNIAEISSDYHQSLERLCGGFEDAGAPDSTICLAPSSGGRLLPAKWTFPKGDPEPSISHSQAAEREAWEEAGARGHIEPRHFHLYIHSKGVFWKPPGVREFVVKAFLLEVEQVAPASEPMRNPTWFSADDAKKTLAKGREVKYARELQAVVDRALEQIGVVNTMAAR